MQNVFSNILTIEDMGNGHKNYVLEASEQQMQYIAEILKLEKIKSFKALMDVNLQRKAHKIEINGKIQATVLQTSVISLEKFDNHYQTEFSRHFDTELTPVQLKEMEFDFDEDEPEIIDNGQIDLAAIAMEELALIIDDFPRKKGEIFKFESEFDEETSQKNNPFAALAKLKK